LTTYQQIYNTLLDSCIEHWYLVYAAGKERYYKIMVTKGY